MREYAPNPENKSRTLDSNPRASKQVTISEILQTYQDKMLRKSVPRQSADEEELLQGKFESALAAGQASVQREEKPTNTGLPDNLKSGIENFSGKTIQRKLNIKSTGNEKLFEKLTYKQYKSLKSRMDVPISSWLLLRKMALNQETFTFKNWREAIEQAPKTAKTNPLIFANTVYGMREDIVKERTNKDRNKKMVSNLVDMYNQDKKSQGVQPYFKSPETKANKLLMFGNEKDKSLSEKINIENVANDKKQFYPAFESEVFIEWAEDHLNVFGDLYSTTLPIYDYEGFSRHEKDKGFKGKILEERAKRSSLTSAMSYTTDTSIVPSKPDKHIFLRSVVDGGNMLPAPDFAIIGKDSVVATSIQNGINEQEAKNLIAEEYGYKVEKLCFVEQPDYHIDLMLMLLGDNKVMVKQKNKDTELKQTIEDLQSFRSPQLTVITDHEEIAGKQLPDGKWEYNFFNGEYVIGKDEKLYYVTNGTVNEKAEETFRAFLKKNVSKLEDVIFSKKINSNLLNESNGGLGCRFKGAKST